jgi:hypothetical protein
LEVKNELILKGEMREKFLNLKNYRVLVHGGILQNLFYFLGYTKLDVNKPNTNIMNWKKVKTLLTEEDFFSRIRDYDYKGPKGAVKSYALINRL